MVSEGHRIFSKPLQLSTETIVATSSTESEYVAAASCCAQLYILPAESLVSAGSSMFLLVVILPAESLVSAGCTMILLVVILSAG
ncbi:hypothetical protein Tco_1464298 [Tanacetum coccineum]